MPQMQRTSIIIKSTEVANDLQNTKNDIATFLIATALASTAAMQYTEAASALCPAIGLNGENRCYAVKNYMPDYNPLSVNIDVVADDVTATGGFMQNALWSHLSDGRFIEAGFLVQTGNIEKIVYGEAGDIDLSTRISLSDGHRFNIYAYELANGAVWKIGIEHRNSNAERACVT